MPPRPSNNHGPLASAILSYLFLSSAAQTFAQAPESRQKSNEFTGAVAKNAPLQQTEDSPARPAPVTTERLGFRDRFWLVDPRTQPSKPDPDLMKFEGHGEYQIRFSTVPNPALSDYDFADYGNHLGQSHRLDHRMRFNPRFSYRENFAVVAQVDVPYGMILGQSSDHLARDPEPMTATQPMRLSWRWFYADMRIGSGRLRVGQQPARWGSGLVLDSGDERQFLGDSRFGTIVERVAYQGMPFGPRSNFELLLATDWVYSDTRIRWLDGDRALRSMVGVSFVGGPQKRIGLLVLGENYRPKFSNSALDALRPTETTATFDLAGESAFPVPGQPAFIVASAEAAAVVGNTDIAPEVLAPSDSRVERFGILSRLGAIGTRGAGPSRWGHWGLMLEWGYASSDSNPGDRVDRRFVTNPSRRVGLILFDEVLRWKSARSAAALQDARLGMRPTASSVSMSTAGGVSGATYLSLQGLYRPLPNFDLRAAALVAQASSDVVDPVRLLVNGRWTNYDGGSPSHRDFGLELDLAAEFRQPLDQAMGLSIGAEGGVLFPGRAFADANERTLGTQQLVRGRLGFYF